MQYTYKLTGNTSIGEMRINSYKQCQSHSCIDTWIINTSSAIRLRKSDRQTWLTWGLPCWGVLGEEKCMFQLC